MRVLVADNHAEVRSALRLLLEQALSLDVTGEVTDGTRLLSGIDLIHPDLVLLDWELPGAALTDLLAILHESYPGMQVVVLSSQPEAEEAALAAGATAFISKGAAPDQLLRALQALGERESEARHDETPATLTGG